MLTSVVNGVVSGVGTGLEALVLGMVVEVVESADVTTGVVSWAVVSGGKEEVDMLLD